MGRDGAGKSVLSKDPSVTGRFGFTILSNIQIAPRVTLDAVR
jgi:hypothetical protein